MIDAQPQEYEQPCTKLRDLIKTCSAINKNISYEIFIHKVDSDIFASDDQKIDCLNDIQELMKQLLSDVSL